MLEKTLCLDLIVGQLVNSIREVRESECVRVSERGREREKELLTLEASESK